MHSAVRIHLVDNLLDNAKTIFSCATLVNFLFNYCMTASLSTYARRESLEIENFVHFVLLYVVLRIVIEWQNMLLIFFLVVLFVWADWFYW